jgi:hypothetical protein
MATVRTTDLAGAAVAMSELTARLSDPREIQDAIGAATSDAINQAGARTSSPAQAIAVAGAFGYAKGGGVISLDVGAAAGRGTAGALVWGSEFGSDLYRQFGPRHSGGTWIFPTLRELPKPVVDAGDAAIEQVIGEAI